MLVITAHEALNDRIRILDLGADDYPVKPFAIAEFEARVRGLLRRSVSHGATHLSVGRLRLDIPGHYAWIGDSPLKLTARELGLIEALATRSHRATIRAQLVKALCSGDQDLTDNGLDIAIYRVRRKLKASGASIRTIRGLAYLLGEETNV